MKSKKYQKPKVATMSSKEVLNTIGHAVAAVSGGGVPDGDFEE